MAMLSGGRSALKSNTPLFIPAALHAVEDFSPEWRDLVKNSTWFEDYWLSKQKEDELNDICNNDYVAYLLPDSFDVGIDKELTALEDLLGVFVQSPKAKERTKSANAVLKKQKEPLNVLLDEGLELDTLALLKNLNLSNSPKGRRPNSPLWLMKQRREKPPKCVSPRYVPRRIQQPR